MRELVSRAVAELMPVLKAYGLSSLTPQQWEEVDHGQGPLTEGGQGEEIDPLGIRARLSS